MTPRQLFDWAKSNIRNISFAYVAQEEYAAEERLLECRFSEAVTVPGTQQFHSFVPVKKGVVQVKYFSNSIEYSLGTCVIPAGMFLPLEEIQGFVPCMYDSTWWLGCVLNVNTSSNEIQISFLHPHGPSTSFVYPSYSDILWVSRHSVLTKVDPSAATGRTYKITEAERNLANQTLSNRN
ncbi:hypothetical protein AVEN_262217-1 [Araneus ventricosus]|uniref:Uncharacterized protein n=1 Tax=Araneus ventricosus TaxID=182803 RepID=A0A4Y2URG6_ARAVE|nr:hypothetical protein AVEN_170591-1 [Araneus ventricosus]GBO15468.1 hypothetical protein AVEN_262217-1 [Araneus ventricosus]